MKMILNVLFGILLVAGAAQANPLAHLVEHIIKMRAEVRPHLWFINDAKTLKFRNSIFAMHGHGAIDMHLYSYSVPLAVKRSSEGDILHFVAIDYADSKLVVFLGAHNDAELAKLAAVVAEKTSNSNLKEALKDIRSMISRMNVVLTTSREAPTIRRYIDIGGLDEVALKNLLEELADSVRSVGVKMAQEPF